MCLITCTRESDLTPPYTQGVGTTNNQKSNKQDYNPISWNYNPDLLEFHCGRETRVLIRASPPHSNQHLDRRKGPPPLGVFDHLKVKTTPSNMTTAYKPLTPPRQKPRTRQWPVPDKGSGPRKSRGWQSGRGDHEETPYLCFIDTIVLALSL